MNPEALGTDKTQPRLCQRLRGAIANPETVDRFGGLSLGECPPPDNAWAGIRVK